jgi:hypothetical protein
LRKRRRSQVSLRNSLLDQTLIAASEFPIKTPGSKPDDYSAAAYDVVLRARGQRNVQVWIAGNEIADFSPQAKEAEQHVIDAAAKIKNPAIQELVRRVLAVGKLR